MCMIVHDHIPDLLFLLSGLSLHELPKIMKEDDIIITYIYTL